MADRLEAPWLARDLESRGARPTRSSTSCRPTSTRCAPAGCAEIDKVEREVQARLKREINYWDHRAEAEGEERAGKAAAASTRPAPRRAPTTGRPPAAPPGRARPRAPDLGAAAGVLGGALVIPGGLLRSLHAADASPSRPNSPRIRSPRRDRAPGDGRGHGGRARARLTSRATSARENAATTSRAATADERPAPLHRGQGPHRGQTP